jgi:chromate transporter
MSLLAQLLLTFGTLSLLAIGGANAVLPEMHRQLVEIHGWLDDATFTQLFALAQAAPGPNILAASIMGWRIAGPAGLAVATVGMLLPAAALAWVVAGFTYRMKAAPWLKPAQFGLVPVAVGLIAASGVIMAAAAATRLGQLGHHRRQHRLRLAHGLVATLGAGGRGAAGPAAAVTPTRAELFLAYIRIGLTGFGGVNAWARQLLVEQRGWLSEQEYAEILGVGQVLPGPNALNCAIGVGARFHGAAGAALAGAGLFAGPMLLLMGIAALYDAYGQSPWCAPC